MRLRNSTSGDAAAPPRSNIQRRIADRYDVITELGRGGMARVLHVVETATGRELALKQLLPQLDIELARDSASRFEREFHALAQLAHPRVIQVYEYGFDAAGPYYTMELLDGGDLRELSPLPWRKACELILDVCVGLSLMHSRRLVHRDISPRNIRCTRAGGAKLIDFGAMVPIGAHAQVVGTPAFVAPEVVLGAAVDARTDLFSLGATLYYALTAKHAFPARTFAELKDVWALKPPPPSAEAHGVPTELDRLIAALLSPDPALRPRSIYEVMQRLQTLAEIRRSVPADERQACLVMPSFTGRDQDLASVHRVLQAAGEGSGRAIMFIGGAGVGRTRMLDACALEAQVLGASVLRVMAAAQTPSDFAFARAIAMRLIEARPELAVAAAREADSYDQVFELPAGAQSDHAHTLRKFAPAPHERLAFQDALVRWFVTASRRQLLVIVVDDIHEADDSSIAVLAALAERARDGALVLFTSALDSPNASRAETLEVLSSRCERRMLGALDADQTQLLLGSVFGDEPNLALVSARLHELAMGHPRQTMLLAQHLVDRNIIRYEAGRWALPEQLSAADLPATEQAAIRAVLEPISPLARKLIYAQALSLHGLLTRDEYLHMESVASASSIERAIDELVSAGLVSSDGRVYRLMNRRALQAITAELEPDERTACHRMLAGLYAATERPLWESLRQLLLAGDVTRAFDRLIETWSRPRTVLEYPAIAGMSPSDIGRVTARLLELAPLAGRSAREQFELQRWAVLISVRTDDDLYRHAAPALLTQLEQDSGLAAWRTLTQIDDPQARLTQALQQAYQRYAATAEADRVQAPDAAIRGLVEFAAVSIAISTRCLDGRGLASIPGWLEPFAPLSPLIAAVWQNALAASESVIHRTTERALARWRNVYAQLEHVASGDLQIVAEIRGAIAYGIGTSEASLGLQRALTWAEILDRDPFQRVSAMYLRKIVSLQHGDFENAEHYRRQAELLALQAPTRQMFTSLLALELGVHAAAWDLSGVKHIAERIGPLADRYSGWLPFRHLAEGHHRRLSGDLEGASQAYARCMNIVDPTQNGSEFTIMAWPLATSGYVEVLVALDRAEEARTCAERVLHVCQVRGLQASCHDVERALALAQAKLGDYAAATRRLDHLLARQQELGVSGLNLGATYETRARVAIWARDAEAFERIGRLAAQEYRHGEGSPVGVRYERLIEEARRVGIAVAPAFKPATLGKSAPETGGSTWGPRVAAIQNLRDAAVRAERALEVLCEASGSDAGHLFLADSAGLHWASSYSALSPSLELQQRASEFWERRNSVSEADTSFGSEPFWTDMVGTSYQPVLLTMGKGPKACHVGVAIISTSQNHSRELDPALLSEVARLFSV